MSYKNHGAARFLAASLAAFSVFPSAAFSQASGTPQSFSFGLTAGAIWSDNVKLQQVDKDEGTIGQVGVNLLYDQESRRVKTDININAAYQHYFDDQFDEDVIGGLNGALVLGIVPERFEWMVQDNFGQTRVTAVAADTPDNRQNVQYITTGPDFTIRIGEAMSARLSGRYSITDYEVSPSEGERYSAALALVRQLSSSSLVSLNGMEERFNFDDPLASGDYDRREAYIRYEIQSPRTSLGLDAGYATVDDSAKVSNSALVRLALRRQTSPAGSVRISLGNDFSDASKAFRGEQELNGVSLGSESVLPTTDSFEHRFFLLGWDFSRNRTTFGLNGEYSEESYQNDTTFDRSLSRYGIYFGRQLTSVVSIRLDGRYSIEDFALDDFLANEFQGSVGIIWSAGRTLSWRAQYEYRDRSGDGPLAEYAENRASIFVTWSPLARQ